VNTTSKGTSSESSGFSFAFHKFEDISDSASTLDVSDEVTALFRTSDQDNSNLSDTTTRALFYNISNTNINEGKKANKQRWLKMVFLDCFHSANSKNCKRERIQQGEIAFCYHFIIEKPYERLWRKTINE